MKRSVFLSVLLAMAIPLVVIGQTVIQDGTSFRRQIQGAPVMLLDPSDSTGQAARTDGSGNLLVTDADRDRDLTFHAEMISSDSLRANGDSSVVTTLNGASSLILVLKGCPKVTTTSISRVAIQFRTHVLGVSDSSKTVPLYLYGSTGTGVSAAVGSDSMVVGHTRAGTANAPWPEEMVVYFDLARCGPNGSASSTLFYPGGIAIPLDNLFGRGVRLQNISIRARLISGPAVAGFTATLIGTGL
ncbi:MAG: hypothetical protein ACT4PE_05570 [Candidatus Eiseniibacteriota bacterium]